HSGLFSYFLSASTLRPSPLRRRATLVRPPWSARVFYVRTAINRVDRTIQRDRRGETDDKCHTEIGQHIRIREGSRRSAAIQRTGRDRHPAETGPAGRRPGTSEWRTVAGPLTRSRRQRGGLRDSGGNDS